MTAQPILFQSTSQGFRLETELVIARPRDEVFAFFADAFQLEAITPPWLNFQVLTPAPIPMQTGTLINYQLRLHGIPLRWQSRISVWEPPVRFVDEQLRGPYRFWHHEHSFESIPAGTRVRDVVDYGVPGGWLAERFFVRPDLQRIFTYRSERLRELLAPASAVG